MDHWNREVHFAELRVELPRRVQTLPIIRRLIRQLLHETGATAATVDDVLLATSELCTNAIVHAGPGAVYGVAMRLDRLGCEIEVSDDGGGFDPERVAPPTLSLPGGRGLAIVRALMDQVTVDSTMGAGTKVRARKNLGSSKFDHAAATLDGMTHDSAAISD
jgi:serine/threonine-protein kinase RsbW